MGKGIRTNYRFSDVFCGQGNLHQIKYNLSAHKSKSGRGAGTRNIATKVKLEEMYKAWESSGKSISQLPQPIIPVCAPLTIQPVPVPP